MHSPTNLQMSFSSWVGGGGEVGGQYYMYTLSCTYSVVYYSLCRLSSNHVHQSLSHILSERINNITTVTTTIIIITAGWFGVE